MSQVTEQRVLDALRRIQDPDLHKDIVALGFIKDLQIADGGGVSFRIVLTTPACPVKEQMKEAAEEHVGALEGVTKVTVTMDAEVPTGRGFGERATMPGVRNIVAVSSGKGGVGKSTVAVNIAVSLALNGARIGLMDADVYGPNVPLMLGASAQPQVDGNKLIPVEAHGVRMMSMALLQPGDKPMIVRGPILHGLVRQFLTDVIWGELDYLIVDMPPGTGDVQLSLAQLVPVQGAVLVTTPQEVALADVRRAFRMFETVNVPVIGVVENMSYFIAPDTGARYNIFGEGGGERLANQYDIPFLGSVPLGMEVREGGDKGVPVVVGHPDSPQARAFRSVAEEVARQVSIEAMKPELVLLRTNRAGGAPNA